MFSGGRARLLCASAAVALLASGCQAVDDAMDDTRWGPAVVDGYAPLTEDSFGRAVGTAMNAYDTAHMDMELGEESMSMDVRFDTDGFGMVGTYDDGTTVSEMRMVDEEIYVRDEGESVFYQFPDQLVDQMTAGMGLTDPTQFGDDFGKGIDHLTYTESHEVPYGMAHHYVAHMSKDFLAEKIGLPLDQVPDVAYDIWIDDAYLVHRMKVWSAGTLVDVTYSAWGEPVSIEAPPARKIEPLPMPSDEV